MTIGAVFSRLRWARLSRRPKDSVPARTTFEYVAEFCQRDDPHSMMLMRAIARDGALTPYFGE